MLSSTHHLYHSVKVVSYMPYIKTRPLVYIIMFRLTSSCVSAAERPHWRIIFSRSAIKLYVEIKIWWSTCQKTAIAIFIDQTFPRAWRWWNRWFQRLLRHRCPPVVSPLRDRKHPSCLEKKAWRPIPVASSSLTTPYQSRTPQLIRRECLAVEMPPKKQQQQGASKKTVEKKKDKIIEVWLWAALVLSSLGAVVQYRSGH